MDECLVQTDASLRAQRSNRPIASSASPPRNDMFPRQIAFNVIPQVSDIMDDGFTKEEEKISKETQKILGIPLNITATCVRVPVLVGHSMSISIQFNNKPSMREIEKAYANTSGIQFLGQDYKTAVEIEGSDDLFIGRARLNDMGLHLWLCSDNLHRGAATDAVEIVEKLMAL